jgi:sugar (pentulose or hexulose) kinase
LLEMVLLGGTYTISWFVNEFSGLKKENLPPRTSIEEMFDASLDDIPPGSNGLMVVPYWNTVMNPYWDSAASGMVVGWRGIHQTRHLYRAVLEGIAFEQRLHTEGTEAAVGGWVKRFIACGGGVKNARWCQIIADITGKEVVRSAVSEGTALGAGILAACGTGLFENAQASAAAMSSLEAGSFKPDQDRHEIYSRLYNEVYHQLFPAVQPYLDRLTELAES